MKSIFPKTSLAAAAIFVFLQFPSQAYSAYWQTFNSEIPGGAGATVRTGDDTSFATQSVIAFTTDHTISKITAIPTVELDTRVSSNDPFSQGGYASALLIYSVTIVGPYAGEVPITFHAAYQSTVGSGTAGSSDIQFNLQETSTGHYDNFAAHEFLDWYVPASGGFSTAYLYLSSTFASGDISLTTGSLGLSLQAVGNQTNLNNSKTFMSNGAGDYIVGDIFGHFLTSSSSLSITMSVIANARGNMETYLDPVFEIDPAFLATHPGLSISAEQYFANASPVPEPSTALVLLAGLTTLGWRFRRPNTV